MVRRFFFGAALTALIIAVFAMPAAAATNPTSVQWVSANIDKIGKALKTEGVIPATASKAQTTKAVLTYLQAKFSKPEDHPRSSIVTRTGKVIKYDPKCYSLANLHKSRFAIGEPYVSHTLVILVDFGSDATGSGPLHGQIPPPGPADNSTFWPGDFSTTHYQKMLFGNSYPIYDASGDLRGTSHDTMRSYYLEQSHMAFTVGGDVVAWVTVPHPESWYGADTASGIDDANGPVWRVVEDAVDTLAAQHPDFPWAEYDQENPFGLEGGSFYQPDGYIDHLILVHAGVDESAGGGAQGSDAIWAHSWWVNPSGGGVMIPGTQTAGNPDGIWVGPYTINPEDGGIGVFCHEFGHDLGLPDEYDTTYLGESPSGFWTLMSDGSWCGKAWGLETRPSPMNAWDKYYLGWIDPVTVGNPARAAADQPKTSRTGGQGKDGFQTEVDLQPAATGDPSDVAVKIDLPDYQYEVPLGEGRDYAAWWSNMGNDLSNTLTTSETITVPSSSVPPLPAGASSSAPGDQVAPRIAGPQLTFDTWYDIEEGYDFGFVQVSTNDGGTWATLRDEDGVTQDAGGGMYGLTGSSGDAWVTMHYDMSAYAGQEVLLRFLYQTDEAVALNGWEVYDITCGPDLQHVTADTSPDPFTTGGWLPVDGGAAELSAPQYYIGEFRNRMGFDRTLLNVYNFSNLDAGTVEWFPYNWGLHLIWRNTAFSDNDVGLHPGLGGWMVIDAHPVPDYDPVLGFWRTRIQVRDAAFSLKRTGYFSLRGRTLPGYAGQPLFDDSLKYWYSMEPDAGVKVPGPYGVSLRVLEQDYWHLLLGVSSERYIY